MKKILAMATAVTLTAGVSAYATNPFSDVSTSDWAYQAVSALSHEGIVEGYPDGTFKGEKNMTRYELAQIIARLMAREDQLNLEQKATVDKLASAYADELASLGVRVTNVEKKLGQVAFTGDARMRYQARKNKGEESYNGRIRLNAKAKVNDSTTIHARLVGNMNFKTGAAANVSMDTLNVKHHLGMADITLGRYFVSLGNQGGWLVGIPGFDGVEAKINVNKKANLAVGYGRFPKQIRVESIYAKGNMNLGFVKIDGNYIKVMEKSEMNKYEFYGAGAYVPMGDFHLLGEYWKNEAEKENNKAWNAGIGYKAHGFTLDIVYNEVEKNAALKALTGYGTDVLGTMQDTDLTFWNVLADVSLMKGVTLHGEYAFDVKADGKKVKNDWMVSLNYKF